MSFPLTEGIQAGSKRLLVVTPHMRVFLVGMPQYMPENRHQSMVCRALVVVEDVAPDEHLGDSPSDHSSSARIRGEKKNYPNLHRGFVNLYRCSRDLGKIEDRFFDFVASDLLKDAAASLEERRAATIEKCWRSVARISSDHLDDLEGGQDLT